MASENPRVRAITLTSVKGAKAEAARYTIWDEDLKGFGLQVTPQGVKTYIVRYRLGGGRAGVLRQYKLGRVGPLTPEEARKMAKDALASATKGEDPQGSRAQERAALTVAALCDDYMAAVTRSKSKKPSTLYIDRVRVARHIKPLLGKKRLSQLTEADVADFVTDITTGVTKSDDHPLVRGGAATARRALGLLKSMLDFAVSRGLCAANAARGVKYTRERARERFLTFSELERLGDVLTAMEAEGWDKAPLTILRLLALTGARKNEIARLRWVEVDAERSMLRLADTKTGPKVLQLGAASLELLARVERTNGAFVFPHPGDLTSSYRGLDYKWTLIRARADLGGLRIHDLRHTNASVGLSLGMGLPLIQRLLGHANPQTTARYAHLADDPVKAAADRVAGAVSGAMGGKSAKVAPMTRGA